MEYITSYVVTVTRTIDHNALLDDLPHGEETAHVHMTLDESIQSEIHAVLTAYLPSAYCLVTVRSTMSPKEE